MNVFEIHAKSVGDVQDYLGESCPVFLWPSDPGQKQVKVRILPGSVKRRKKLQDGGFQLEADLRFVARAEDLPSPGPDLKQTIFFDDQSGNTQKVYRIDSMEVLAGGTLVRFECNDPDGGA